MNQLSRACPTAGGLDDAPIPLVPAVLCTLGTVTVPSAASVYNEFALKRHMETSVHLQVRVRMHWAAKWGRGRCERCQPSTAGLQPRARVRCCDQQNMTLSE